MNHRGTFALFSALTLLHVSASAEADESATAEPEGAVPDEATKLFEEGRALSAAGNYPAACEKFEHSAALAGGAGTKFNLADCYEHLGKNKSARDLFVEVAAMTRKLGQAKRERAALARASALDAKMARITVDLRAAGPGVHVSLDGKELAAGAIERPIDVDLGEHEIVASAQGKEPWSFRVAVPNGPANVVIVVPALEAEIENPAASEPRPKPQPRKPNVKPEGPIEAEVGSSTRRTITLVLGGAGVAGLAGGAYMAVRYRQNHEDSKVICPSSRGCTDAEIDAHAAFVDEAKTARTWSYVGFGVGGAALIGAAYSFLSAPDDEEGARASVQATPFVGIDGSVGGAVSGRF